MGMCDTLKVLPSQIYEEYPDMTPADKLAYMKYVHHKDANIARLMVMALTGKDPRPTARPG